MHEAFQVTSVLEKLNKVESICAYGDKLLVGTSTGQLLVYRVTEPLVAGDEKPKVELVDTRDRFSPSRRPIEQIDFIKEMSCLVSLSDGYVSLHDHTTFELITKLSKSTKGLNLSGVNLFAVQTSFEMTKPGDGSEGIPIVITRLALAVKRRLVIYTWKDTEFEEPRDFGVPDRVKAMTWVGGSKLCVGFASEYALMDVETGAFTDLFAPTGPPDASKLSNLYNSALGSKVSKPLVTKIPNNEMLLGKDNVSIFLGLDGSPTRRVGIEWSGVPEEMGFSYPFVIAILPKHVEVRNIETQALVQQIPLNQAKYLNDGRLLYIASPTQVWRLMPFSFNKQIDDLVARKEYAEAISLLEQLEPILLEKKEERMQQIRDLLAHHLFHEGQFEASLNLFTDLGTNPAEVLTLYPEDISAGLRLDKKELKAKLQMEAAPKEGAQNEESGSSNEDTQSQASTSTSDQLEGAKLEQAVSALIRFLTEQRQKNSKILYRNHLSPASPRSPLETSINEAELRQYQEMARLIDTALLKCYMMTNDALVGPLLRVQNNCDVNLVETLLLEKHKYRELVDLYQGKGLHEKSLELLHRLSEEPANRLQGVIPTILYLQKLGAEHFDLILKYSKWVLEQDPDEGMQIFLDESPEVESFDRMAVCSHLEAIKIDLAIIYLEHIIHEWDEDNEEAHNKLILLYLRALQQEDSAVAQETRDRLLRFLSESTFYRPQLILNRIPSEGFFEERAILLSRLGEHEQALKIYVYKLHNYSLAEDYCNRLYQEDPDEGRRNYLTLLRVYLRGMPDGQSLIQPALELLGRHGSQIDAAAVLKELPKDTKLNQVFPFLEKYIREANKTSAMDLVVKNLLRAEQMQVQEQLIYYRSRAVRITEDRMCPQCHKRIGNSVFAVFPNGMVVHYSCKEKIEKAHHTY
ncbi:hypothetical protein BZG36_00891 [Bifiguratus adelaidae]|uniref:CNH domain-containing protein n=1 Tax=Bifiguratus adelaidae TaxID=1938954 RepID=A0A261Y5M7_9FUNG|nr:hypothetical protein BZG36_00891 [Bifiguratus adelaidae]